MNFIEYVQKLRYGELLEESQERESLGRFLDRVRAYERVVIKGGEYEYWMNDSYKHQNIEAALTGNEAALHVSDALKGINNEDILNLAYRERATIIEFQRNLSFGGLSKHFVIRPLK